MENPFKELLKRVQTVPKQVNGWIEEGVDQNKKVLEADNREQLLEGTNVEGGDITPQYKPDSSGLVSRYARLKKKLNPNSKRNIRTPDLTLTGKYSKSIKLDARKKGFVMKASDPKAKFLDKYGQTVGVTQENIGEFNNDFLLPFLQQKTREYFRIK